VEIHIHQTDPVPFKRQGCGQIDGQATLANPALAAHDHQLMADPGKGPGDQDVLFLVGIFIFNGWYFLTTV
jgi:hypothetical protein